MQSPIEVQKKLCPNLEQAPEGRERKEESESIDAMSVHSRRKLPSFIRHSPIYQTLSDLRVEGSPLVETLRIDAIKRKEGGEAFLIHLNGSPENNLPQQCEIFKGYRYKESHFSIDREYETSNSQHGCTPIHYTESYVLEAGEDAITVHVYLDKQCQFIYAQVKKGGSDIKVDAELSKLLKTNMTVSNGVVLPLLKERQDRHLKLKKKADELEAELDILSHSIKDRASLKLWQAKARPVIEKIRESNKYTEVPDPRADRLEAMLEASEKWSKEVQDAENRELLASSSSSISASVEPVEVALPVVEKEEISELEKLYSKLVLDLRLLREKLSKKVSWSVQDLENIKQRHEIIKELDQKLMFLFEFPSKFLDEASRKSEMEKLFKECVASIVQHEEEGLRLLKQEALLGNIEIVKELFSLFGNKLGEEFYTKLLDSLVKKPEDQEKLMSVCEFFNENTEPYRIAVLSFSRQAKYIIREQDINKLFILATEESLKINYTCEASALFKLYCCHQLQVFEMLLKHGADPNTWGFVRKGETRKALSIFQTIATWSTSNYTDYLKFLIFYGGNPNVLVNAEEQYAALKERVSNLKVGGRKGISPGLWHKTGAQVSDHIATAPPLVFSIDRGHVEVCKFLLPYTSLDMIAYAFARVAVDRNICSISFPSSNALTLPVQFFDKRGDVEKAVLLVARPPYEGPFFNVFFCKNSNGRELKNKFELFQVIYQMLIKKLKDVDTKQFDEIYQRLFKRGTELNAMAQGTPVKLGPLAYHYFSACMFLLVTYASNLELDNQKLDLVSRYHKDWLKQMNLALLSRYCEPDEVGILEGTKKKYLTWSLGIGSAIKNRKREVKNISGTVSSSAAAGSDLLSPDSIPSLTSSLSSASSLSNSSFSSELKQGAESREVEVDEQGRGIESSIEEAWKKLQDQVEGMLAGLGSLGSSPEAQQIRQQLALTFSPAAGAIASVPRIAEVPAAGRKPVKGGEVQPLAHRNKKKNKKKKR